MIKTLVVCSGRLDSVIRIAAQLEENGAHFVHGAVLAGGVAVTTMTSEPVAGCFGNC